MKRNVIVINEELCNGCGACVEGCHEGALQLIDGKARIVSELYCDGLGACIGDCPVGAISITEKEAEPYDEIAVMERIVSKGEKTILAHFQHLKTHGELNYLEQGIGYIKQQGIKIDLSSLDDNKPKLACGCSGNMEKSFGTKSQTYSDNTEQHSCSGLIHWPVQLHLLNPSAGYFSGADVVLAADCTAYSIGDFHSRFLRGNVLAIACPKLDSNKEAYIEKITQMIDNAQINTLTIVIMEVPCCGGLIQIVQLALKMASRKIPIKKIVVGIQGDIKENIWI